MAALRLELEITTVEPSGTMVFVEGHASGGVQVGLMIPAGTLPARIGQRLTVSVETLNATSAPSMRERMGRAATTEAPRSAAAAPASTAGSTQTDAPGIAAGVHDHVLATLRPGPPRRSHHGVIAGIHHPALTTNRAPRGRPAAHGGR